MIDLTGVFDIMGRIADGIEILSFVFMLSGCVIRWKKNAHIFIKEKLNFT
jgi:hypothetical protein